MSPSRSDWARLFRVATSLIRQVNAEQVIVDSWSFGGGTAMMLQIDHRESHDIDIFLADAQLLSYLDPKLRDFEFEIRPSDYTGDGSQFLKLAFEGIGEIDFVVGSALTQHPTTMQTVEGEEVRLETLAAIERLNPEFVNAAIAGLAIKDSHRPIARTAIADARELLQAV